MQFLLYKVAIEFLKLADYLSRHKIEIVVSDANENRSIENMITQYIFYITNCITLI